MGHLGRDLDGEFHEALIPALEIEWYLEDNLFYPLLLYGIGIGLSGFEHLEEFGPGWFRMAVQHALADEFQPAVFLEHLPCLPVHIEDDTLGIADRYSAGEFVCPVDWFHNYLLKL